MGHPPSPTRPASAATPAASSPPRLGERFPAIALRAPGGAEVRIPEDFAGRTVLLAWFPLAFSPLCTEQLSGFRQAQEAFAHLDTTVVGVSVDHWYTNAAYRASLGVDFPILSDWFRTEAGRLGILLPEKGYAKRVLYLLDREGVLRWQRAYARGECPRPPDFLEELRKLA